VLHQHHSSWRCSLYDTPSLLLSSPHILTSSTPLYTTRQHGKTLSIPLLNRPSSLPPHRNIHLPRRIRRPRQRRQTPTSRPPIPPLRLYTAPAIPLYTAYAESVDLCGAMACPCGDFGVPMEDAVGGDEYEYGDGVCGRSCRGLGCDLECYVVGAV